MKKKYILSHQSILISVSILFWLYLLGPYYINPLNDSWLYNGDLSIYQLGWRFFKSDIWRFPLGINPNYGIYLGGSVVFSDSIPFLAFIFKIFKNFLPDNFQYFSLWILICIYLQIYLAYKIVFCYTRNSFYSLISSFFFLISTAFIHRSGIHLSLMGHWLLLLYFFVNVSDKIKFRQNKKKYLIIFSCLIHFYFTLILIIIYFIESFLNLKLNFNYIIKYVIHNFIFLISLILLMYITGYFSFRLDDAIGGGYGYFNFNLNSFFNPSGNNNLSSFSWSNIMPVLKFQNGNMEGFSYLGISGLIFFAVYIFNLIKGRYEIIFNRKISLLIIIILLLLATSNNISFGEYNLLYIKLNNYLYLFLNSFRASGRLIWPIYYMIIFCGIIYIYLSLSKRNANIIISILLILQLIDLMPGLLKYKFGKQFTPNVEQFVNSESWSGLSNRFHEIRHLNPENQSELFYNLAKHLMSEKYHKTDVAYLARISRESIENVRYDQVKKFNSRDIDIFKNRIFVTKNISLIKNLKVLYKDKIYVYYIDKIWLVSTISVPELMPHIYPDAHLEYFKIDKTTSNFYTFKENETNPFGFGWEYDEFKKKFVSLGYSSNLIFKLNNKLCENKFNLKFNIEKYFNNTNSLSEIKIVLNNEIIKSVLIEDKSNIDIELSNVCKNSDIIKLDFYYINPTSKYEKRKGLNRKKRAIVLNYIQIE